jgi:hypothetical protein
MRSLKVKSSLMVGGGVVSLLFAAVLLGTGQLVFGGIFLGVSLLFIYLRLKPKSKATESVNPGAP